MAAQRGHRTIRSSTRSAIELQSYTGTNETTIKAGTPKEEDDNSSQEYMYILQGRDENIQGGTEIMKTVVTSVESRAFQELGRIWIY